jgi:hypothetical protein
VATPRSSQLQVAWRHRPAGSVRCGCEDARPPRDIVVQPAVGATESTRLPHHRPCDWRQNGEPRAKTGVLTLQQVSGGAHGGRGTARSHFERSAPSPLLLAWTLLPVNLPFRTPSHSLPPPPSLPLLSSPRSWCDLSGSFSCRLLRSAATPFGLCPRSFLPSFH